jgi:hypothetical protein
MGMCGVLVAVKHKENRLPRHLSIDICVRWVMVVIIIHTPEYLFYSCSLLTVCTAIK